MSRFALDIGQLQSDDTSHTAAGAVADVNCMRRRLGRWQTLGGWESVISQALGGVCRAVFPWTDNAAILNIAFGTHETLEIYQGGELADVTPTLAHPSATLSNPFTVSDGSTTVAVTHPGHGLATSDSIIVSGAVPVGRITPNGTFSVTKINDDSYSFTFGGAADTAKTLANNPFAVTSGSALVTVTETAHNIQTGTTVTFSGASAVGGITPNGAFAITVIDANSYSFTFTANASSTASGGGASVVATVPTTGGGTAVVVAPQRAFEAGEINGTGTSGYGTGGYGVGGYGEPSTDDYFPRTWAWGAFGQTLIGCPRGGTIYQWANDLETPAAPVANAPRQVTYALVTPQDQIMALGCSEEVSGLFRPLCIRHSSVRNATQWNTGSGTTAREYTLPGGGQIVSGRVLGPHVLVWTTSALYLGQFVGSLEQPWRFDKIGERCGLIGQGAAVVVGQTAYWISKDRQFYTYTLGGAPQPISCPIREDFGEHLSASQADKIVASSIAEFSEVRWDYPDSRDGSENSRYVALCVAGDDAGSWFRGIMARTAMVDAGPSDYPCGVTVDGQIYWHERGASADGAAIQYHVETADFMIDEDFSMMVRECRPDIKGQVGPVSLTLTFRDTPQGSATTAGPYALTPDQPKQDLRSTGKFFKIRLSGDSAPAFARIGRMVFDVARAGGR